MSDNRLRKVTIYVTQNQYIFLTQLKKQKVSMSQFIRTLIEWFRNSKANSREEEEIFIRIRKKKRWYTRSKLQKELLAELKQVLKKRRKKAT